MANALYWQQFFVGDDGMVKVLYICVLILAVIFGDM
jgi:hypothetical protein